MPQVKKNKDAYSCDFAVDLTRVVALFVRVLRRSHLQHAHPKGIDINGLVVMLIIHLWRHELRCTLKNTKDVLYSPAAFRGGKETVDA